MPRMIYNNNLEMEPPTILLKRKDFTTLGALSATAIRYRDTFNSCREMTFQVHRPAEEALDRLWEEVNDYHIIYLPEYGEYFDMHVTLNEQAGVYKTVTCRSLAEAELMQVKLYDLEVNLETDRMREDYDSEYSALLYRDLSGYEKGSEEYNTWKNRSLLHRVLDKAPNYEIGEVDTSLKDLKSWYEFNLSDTDIYSALTGEIAEAYECLFQFEITRDGRRLVHVHDLCNTCRCGYRGDFHDACPVCGGRDFSGAYGRDTTILVSKDNLAASASIESNKDRLKNCFRVSGGDDIMTAAVAGCNPNGSNYFWDFSVEMLETMPEELRDKLEQYNREYQAYRTAEPFAFDTRHVREYNEAVRYVNEKSGKSVMNGSGSMADQMYGSRKAGFRGLPEAAPQAVGYDSLMALLYDAEDLKLYLQHGMMPVPSLERQTIEEAVSALTEAALSPVAVSNPAGAKDSIVSNAVIGRAKTYVNTALYRIAAEPAEGAGFYTPPFGDGEAGTWRGHITLTSIADKTKTKKTGLLTIRVNGDYESCLKQELERKMAGADHSIKDIIGMPEGILCNGEYDAQADREFNEAIMHYSIRCLEHARTAYADCIAVITASENEELKKKMKAAYDGRVQKLDEQIKKMEGMLAAVDAIRGEIEAIQEQVRERFDLESYLGGGALWGVFCSYRREDSYKNDNYVSDGLDNAGLIRRANQLIEAARKELKKASTLQYNVSASLNNLLAMREFRPIVDDFACGNWIHMMVDDKIYHLRLLSYEVDFDNLSNLSVEFSTVEKIWSGISDIRSILSSASQVAGSYSATLSRVNNSAKAAKYVENWVEKGLDATATKIVNNAENQEIVIDQTGIMCRRYQDLEGEYDPCQARIINNGIYTTKNNWKDVSTGLGKICYIDPETNREVEDYGLIAKTVVGKLFIGEGLKIYGKDNAVVLDENGITLDGGKISWKTKLSQDAVSGLGEELSDIRKDNSNTNQAINNFRANVNQLLNVSLPVTEIGSDYVFSPHIGGGYLYIKDARSGNENTGTSVEINPSGNGFAGHNKDYVFRISKESGTGEKVVMGVTNDGDGYFDGNINARSGKIANFNIKNNCIATETTEYGDNGIYFGEQGLSIGGKFRVNADGNVILPEGTEISWEDGGKLGQLHDYITNITEDTVTTSFVNALNITAASVAAENITGTTISGKIIEGTLIKGGEVKGSTIEGGTINGTTIVSQGNGYISRINSGHIESTLFTLLESEDGEGLIPGLIKLNFAQDKVTNGLYLSDQETLLTKPLYITKDASGTATEYPNIGLLSTGRIYVDGAVCPDNDGEHACGRPDYKWSNVYAQKTEIDTSDRNEKHEIRDIGSRYEELFFKLKPVNYMFHDGDRVHMGMIAQDLEESMDELGLSDLDVAAFCRDMKMKPSRDEVTGEVTEVPDLDEEGKPQYRYGVRYGEFIMLNTHMVQKLYKIVAKQQKEIEQLKEKVHNMG